MNYGTFKHTVEALLSNGLIMPEKDEAMIALIGMGLSYVSNKADALKLISCSKSDQIIRKAQGGNFTRKPNNIQLVDIITKVPLSQEHIDIQELDIDEDLCYPLIRLVVSYLVSEPQKSGYHINQAKDMITQYNQKIESIYDI